MKYTEELKTLYDKIIAARSEAYKQQSSLSFLNRELYEDTNDAILEFGDELERAGSPTAADAEFDDKIFSTFIVEIEKEFKESTLNKTDYNPTDDLGELRQLMIKDMMNKLRLKAQSAPQASTLPAETIIEKEKFGEEDEVVLEEEMPTRSVPLKVENFFRCLRGVFTKDFDAADVRITDEEFTFNWIKQPQLKVYALVQMLKDAKFQFKSTPAPEGAMSTIISIKLPLPDEFDLPVYKYPMDKGTSEQQKTVFKMNTISLLAPNPVLEFREVFQNRYMELLRIYQQTEVRPENPTYLKPLSEDEVQFKNDMKMVQPTLLALLDENSPLNQWVKTSKHVSQLESLTEDMLKAMKPFPSPSGYSPPAILSFNIALRNFTENPAMMINFMRDNPEFNDLMTKCFPFIKVVQRDFDVFCKQQVQSTQTPQEPLHRPSVITATKVETPTTQETGPSQPDKENKDHRLK